MKQFVVLIVITILFAILAIECVPLEVDPEAEEAHVKRLNLLVKVLVDRLAADKVSELLSESDSNNRHENLLVRKKFLIFCQFKFSIIINSFFLILVENTCFTSPEK